MKRKSKLAVEPSKAEMEILQVLWEHGPSTVRFVYDQLSKAKNVQYTSVLKQMQLMAEKGLLRRDETQMKHIYTAVYKEDQVQEYFLERFVESFYKGATGKLIMQLLGNKKTSKEDLDYIREQLRKLE